MPADVLYQLKANSEGKQRYAIARVDGEPMAFAGLLEEFGWPDGTISQTFTIITTNANKTLCHIHDRVPVIVEQKDWPIWLGEVEGSPTSLLRITDEHVLRVWPVGKSVRTRSTNAAQPWSVWNSGQPLQTWRWNISMTVSITEPHSSTYMVEPHWIMRRPSSKVPR